MRIDNRSIHRYDNRILYALLLALVHLVGVLAKQRSSGLLVKEHMTGLAQQHEPALVQVLVVGLVLVVDIEELRPLVRLATELASAVTAG